MKPLESQKNIPPTRVLRLLMAFFLQFMENQMENQRVKMLKTLSVSELSSYITNIFEAEELLHDIKVYGEVSGLSSVRGNLYFNIKDENALIACIMFGADAQNVKEGDQIVVSGSMRYYGKFGKINFYVTSIVPYGSGLLYQKFLELNKKLRDEGLFDDSHKKPLPKNISKIGVITSKTGAVLHDIEKVSHRRNPMLEIVVYPAKVQGVGAEKTIIDGLKYFDKQKDIDVIIIARGGGSIEDLQPFNTESLAREIVATSKPVVSAVGHQTDITICDNASSVRAATPSEAGEIVARNMFEGIDKFKNNLDKLYFLENNLIDEKFYVTYKAIDKINNQFSKVFSNKFNRVRGNALKLNSLNLTDKFENTLSIDENKILVLDPIRPFKRGYARLTKGEKLIRGVKGLKNGDEIDAEFLDGNATVFVEKICEVKK
ncbi:MAG: exodeoxyribonuclease VII large subunit [Clostridia bacterium]|nr:exodeoxyribonuclease VII large subunit [Clostridia bacterium]